MGHVTDLKTSKTKSRQNTSKALLKSFLNHIKHTKNFRFFRPYLIHGSCNGFADLEKKKSSKHVLTPFKIVFKLLETKKKFSIFFTHTLYMGLDGRSRQ